MSYDINLVQQDDGEALDEAFARSMELQEEDQAPNPTQEERAAWDAIATEVCSGLSTPERFDGEHFVQIMDAALGMDLTLGGAYGTALSVAYWHEGPDAVAAMTSVARCVATVERATGLIAFDPQTGAAFLAADEDPDAAGRRLALGLELGHRMLHAALRPKRWWQFWR